MRNIYLLAKNYFICAIGSLRGKTSKLKLSFGILFVILVVGALFGFLQYSALLQANGFMQTGLVPIELILYLGYFIGFFLSIIFILQKVTGGQKANDAELLLTMPVKKSEIIIAKAISRYLFNLAVVVLFVLPNIIAYFIYVPITITNFLGCFLTLLFIPLFSVGLSYLFDYLSIVLFPASRFSNIIKTIFSIALIIGFIFIYEFIVINPTNNEILNFNMSIINWIVGFNPVFFLSFIAISISLFLIGTLLFSRTLSKQQSKERARAVDLSGKKSTTQFKSLLKNEFNRFTNSTILMINSLIGVIGIIVLTIWLVIDKGESFQKFSVLLGLPSMTTPILITFVFTFMAVMTYPSAFSISMEGKQFWILKTLPINTNSILLSKGLFNVMLFTPLSIICSLSIILSIKMTAIMSLILIFVPILVNLCISFGGVLVNLLYPKFDYESDVAVVKQSMSGIVMLFGGLALMLVIAVPTFLMINSGVAMYLVLLFSILLSTLFAVTLISLTFTVGKRIFNRL